MKKLIRSLCVVIVLTIVLSFALSMASYDDYDDVEGHWAEAVLRRAFTDGLIEGFSGHLFPDEYITFAQALTMLCRVLGAERTVNISAMGLTGDEWYFSSYSKSAYLGLISPLSALPPGTPILRQDAFHLLYDAFQLHSANPDLSVLERFSDQELVLAENLQATASLVSQGLVEGFDGKLDPDLFITRASFLTLLYRLVVGRLPSFEVSGDYDSGIMLQGPATLLESNFSGGVWFDCTASSISFEEITASAAVIRAHALEELAFGGATHIGRLTLAAQSGDIDISPSDDVVIEMLVVGDGGGSVTVENVRTVEVTGDNRVVTIVGNVDSVIVSGTGSTIRFEPDALVGEVLLTSGAAGSRMVVDGAIGELEIRSIGTSVSGDGGVSLIGLHRADTNIRVYYDALEDHVDIGLSGATLALHPPESLPAGYELVVTTSVGNALWGLPCSATWYIDDIPVSELSYTTGAPALILRHTFEYSREMRETADIRLVLRYTTTLGEQQNLSAEAAVTLENYGKRHWMELDAPGVNERVTLGYLGDFTLQWTEDNDLDDYDKEVWVNTRGYTSSSDYLLWINLAYQRVNIFTRADDGSWELFRSCIVGTGAPGRGTPPGVWTTSYKQLNGWTTSSYTVAPVVRFMGSIGYAFHSRLYFPGSRTISDPSIGYPISRGCVRMYDEDIWYIYDNVPDGTTVVVH